MMLSYTVLFSAGRFAVNSHSSLPRPVLIVITQSIYHGRTRLNPLPVIFGISTGRYFLSRTRPTVSLITASASSIGLDRVMQWNFQYVKVLFFSGGSGRIRTCNHSLSLASLYPVEIIYTPDCNPFRGRASLGPRHCSLLSAVMV